MPFYLRSIDESYECGYNVARFGGLLMWGGTPSIFTGASWNYLYEAMVTRGNLAGERRFKEGYMEEVILKAERRDVIGKQVKALRRAGKLPAIMYGHGIEPTPILLDLRESTRLLIPLAPSALITLQLDGDDHMALIREKQRDFIRGTLKHIDFQIVSALEKLRVPVVVVVEGESPAVKDFNGILVNGLEELEVECTPGDLPGRIVVNISGLKNIGDGIYVRDIVPPANVQILEDPNEMVILVTGPEAEEVEEVAPVVAEEGTEPEVIEHGKKEEEEF